MCIVHLTITSQSLIARTPINSMTGCSSLLVTFDPLFGIVPCHMAEMASSLEELEAIRTKYKNLQREWDNQQEHLGRLQGDMFKMRSQLKNQSSFCASLGAIMGSLMWKTSRMPNVVDVLLSTVSYKFKTNET